VRLNAAFKVDDPSRDMSSAGRIISRDFCISAACRPTATRQRCFESDQIGLPMSTKPMSGLIHAVKSRPQTAA
jgi:hypothetical protein